MFGVVENMKKMSCAECCYLNKTEKKDGILNHYRYKCTCGRRGYIIGSIQKDSELNKMGCSNCNRIKVGTSFTLNKTECFYCGSIKTKCGRKYLIYNASTYVQNGFYVDIVEQNWFSEHIKEIVIKCQTEEQNEALKQTARLYKKRVIKREEENR